MAWRYIFKCDGCDEEKTIESNHVPCGWAEVTIRINGFSNMGIPSQKIERECTLCGTCQQELYYKGDPTTWVRSNLCQ